MPGNISKKDVFLSFTMLVCMCLHIRTQAPVQIFMEFFTWKFTKIYECSSVCTSGTIIDTADNLYVFLSAHLALFGQEIALHKSCRVE